MRIENLSLFISTFFYIGNIKIAPGTVASFVTLILWWTLIPLDLTIRLLIFIFLLIVSIIAIEYSLVLFDEKDPQCIVIDEFIGMSIPMLFIVDNIIIAIASFMLFRFFDIFKPSIIYYSQHYEGTLGILLDDILAGLLTLLILINYL